MFARNPLLVALTLLLLSTTTVASAADVKLTRSLTWDDLVLDENLIEASRGVDLLIHEVVGARDELIEFDERMQLIIDHHTTPEQAGIVFDRVAPGLAVYTHYVLLSAPNVPEVSIDEILERTRTNYSGRLVAGEDLMRFEIGNFVTVKYFPYR